MDWASVCSRVGNAQQYNLKYIVLGGQNNDNVADLIKIFVKLESIFADPELDQGNCVRVGMQHSFPWASFLIKWPFSSCY